MTLIQKKRKEDEKENKRPWAKLNGSKWKMTQSQDLKVGDVIRVNDGERFPADLILLGVKNPTIKKKSERIAT